MNALCGTTRVRGATMPTALVLQLVVSVLATTPAHAALQETMTIRTTRVSLDSTFERLVKELNANRSRERDLVRQLNVLRDSSGRLLHVDTSSTRRLFVQLKDVSRGIFRAQAQLMSLCDRGTPASGYIGVTFESQSMLMRNEDGGTERTAMQFVAYPRIVDVAPGSPAERAGIVRGDSIMELGTTDVLKGGVRFDMLLKPGTKLPVVVRRNGESKALTLVVAKRPNDTPDACAAVDRTFAEAIQPAIIMFDEGSMMAPRAPRPARAPGAVAAPGAVVLRTTLPGEPDEPGAFTFVYKTTGDFYAGAELRRLTPNIAKLTGVEDGVFVVSVARGSPAEQSGLRDGDVIVRANEIPVVRPDQVMRALRDADEGGVKLVVMREKQKQVLTIKLR